QLEARELMLSSKNIFVPGSGKPAVVPTQDMIVGIYYLTFAKKGMKGEGMYFADAQDALQAYERGVIALNAKIKVKGYCELDNDFENDDGTKFTTAGRLIFYSTLPKGYPFKAINRPIIKKDISNIIEDVFRNYGEEAVVEMVEKMKDIGFKFATKSGTTLGLSDIIIPSDKAEVIRKTQKEDEAIRKSVEEGTITLTEGYQELLRIWDLAASQLESEMVKELKKVEDEEYKAGSGIIFNPLYTMVVSGARGNIDQIRQLGAMRGWMANPVEERKGFVGELIGFPIKSNFSEGLSVVEYFISTYGARKTTADTATSTREPGATTRIILNAVLHEPIVTIEDCGTTDGITKMAIYRGSDKIMPLAERIQGRYTLKPITTLEGEVLAKGGELITKEIAEKIEKHFDSIVVRSILRCKAKEGVCMKCYGINPATGKLVEIGEAVGVVAAQSVGEATTQLVLRTFHIGGTERIVEHKIVAPRKGKVEIKTDKELIPILNKKNQYWCISHNAYMKIAGHEKYDIPYGAKVFVKDNEEVVKDQVLAQWMPNLKPLISEWEGVVYYRNIIKGKNAQIIKDELTKKPKLFIYRSGASFEIKLKDGKVINIPIPVDTHIDVKNGSSVKVGSILGYTQVISALHTADIIAGLPRIISLFNVYPPDEQTKAILSNVMGQVSFIEPQTSFYKLIWIQPYKEETIKKYDIKETVRYNNEEVKIKVGVFRLSDPAINKLKEITANIVEPKNLKEFKERIIEGINKVEDKDIRYELYKVRYFIEKDLYKKIGGVHLVDIRSRRIVVEENRIIHVGDPLTTGPIDYRELLEKVDLVECERRLLDEIQLILRTRGANVDDRHVEMILRSMFSFVVIDDPGDSQFFKGDIIARKVLEEENERLRKLKKRPAVFSPYLEGCKMIPQRILQSGLSVFQPSSFQYNRWMLLDAAIRGQVEDFKGLHENLIIGRRIPAGTGFFK
ncbi:MAG: hypothetical protein NZ870_02760, partial [bacterium]|nr:hypothetical protein [bacterium]